MIRFQNNQVISFEISWALHSEADTLKLTAYGTKGTAHLNPLRAYKQIGSNRLDYTINTTSNPVNLFKKSYENELKHFIGAVRDNNPVISSSEDAVELMRLLEAIYKSAEIKKEVSI